MNFFFLTLLEFFQRKARNTKNNVTTCRWAVNGQWAQLGENKAAAKEDSSLTLH